MTGNSQLSIVRSGGSNITLSWNGGEPPFQLHQSFDLTTWEPLGNTTMVRSRNISTLDHPHAFYKLEEEVSLLSGDHTGEETKLVWSVPELQ